MESLQEIELDEIWADELFNARGHISPASVITLADDIRRNGLLQPIVVQPCQRETTHFKIILGHRRFEAIRLLRRNDSAKYSKILCRVIPSLPEEQALVLNLKENLERVDLNMLQEAQGIRRFQHWGWDVKRVSKELGQSKQWVAIRFGLLHLPDEIQRRAAAGYLTQYQIEECIELGSVDQQMAYVRLIVDHKERGKQISSEAVKKKRTFISIMTKGEPRTLAEMALVQDSIQDSFQNNKHPAAMALAWAAGIISYQEFVESHIEVWAKKEKVVFKHHPSIEEKVK